MERPRPSNLPDKYDHADADILIREAESVLFESQQALRAAMRKRP